MDETIFECIVCLSVCRECINCQKCNQILCKEHVKDLHPNRCPSCRAAPFLFQENIALQRIIEQMQEKKRKQEVPPKVPKCTKESEVWTWRRQTAPTISFLTDVIARYRETAPVDVFLADDTSSFGSKVPRSQPHQHEFKKIPNDSFKAVMRAHISRCSNEECRTLWKGKWGTFIGGRKGATHFDLTECPEGRRFNEMLGWNYDDPRC